MQMLFAGTALRAFLLGALSTLEVPPSYALQDTVVIGSEQKCARCTIMLDHVATLGDREGPGTVTLTSVIARDSRGRYYTSHSEIPGLVLVFDSTGSFLKSIGRKGKGPGEYGSVMAIEIGPADTLHFFDNDPPRWTVLDSGYNVVRVTALEVHGIEPRGALVYDNSLSVINATIPSPDRVGFPLHLLEADGVLGRSFGAESPIFRPDVPYLLFRWLAKSDIRKVWATHYSQYVIELWDLNGAQLQRIVRRAQWFRPWLKAELFSPAKAPQPRMADIYERADGRLWTLARVGARDWAQGLRIETNDPPGTRFYVPDRWERVYDSVIELIDPNTGLLVVSERVPKYLITFVGDNLVVGYHEDDEGFPFLDVWRVEVENLEKGEQ